MQRLINKKSAANKFSKLYTTILGFFFCTKKNATKQQIIPTTPIIFPKAESVINCEKSIIISFWNRRDDFENAIKIKPSAKTTVLLHLASLFFRLILNSVCFDYEIASFIIAGGRHARCCLNSFLLNYLVFHF